MHQIKKLRNRVGVQNPKLLELDLILAHTINKPKEFIYTHPEYKLNFFEYLRFKYYLYLLKKNWPVAYIIKHKEFYGLDFYVDKRVLIPRPETELMVEEALDCIKRQNEKMLLIDVGTGSGCIPITLQHLNTETLKHVETIAVDISKKALRVARKNAKKHNVDIKFLHGDLLEPVLKDYYPPHRRTSVLRDTCPHDRGHRDRRVCYVTITANLPYLTKKQHASSPSIQREPKSALVANNSGLAFYEKLLQQIKKLTAYPAAARPRFTGGGDLRLTTFFEIDPSQSKKIKLLIKKYLPQGEISVKKDLAGLDRVVCVEIP